MAVDETDVLGFVAVVIDPADASGEIYMIAVDPAVQRRGVGRALTAHALERLGAASCTLAVVATGGDPGHAPARGLYKAAGFTAVPLVRDYRTINTPQNPPTDPADWPSPTLPQDQRRARIAAESRGAVDRFARTVAVGSSVEWLGGRLVCW